MKLCSLLLHVLDRFVVTSVYVDVTPPLKGVVKDGKDPDSDEVYSSDAATVCSTWKRFSDPESGIRSYHVDVYRKPAGAKLI